MIYVDGGQQSPSHPDDMESHPFAALSSHLPYTDYRFFSSALNYAISTRRWLQKGVISLSPLRDPRR